MAEEAVAVELEVGVNEPETDETVEAGVPRPVEIELTAQELRSPPTKKKKVRSSPDINASRMDDNPPMEEALGHMSIEDTKPSKPARFTTLPPTEQEKMQKMLYEATYLGYPKAAGTLLEAGVPVDRQDNQYKDYTALMYACESLPENSDDPQPHNKTAVVKLLLRHNPDLAKGNKHKMTALYMACLHGHLDLVKLLVAHCEPGRAEDVARVFRDESLMRDEDRIQKAREESSTESHQLQKLLNAKTQKSWTALMAALKKGHMDIVRYLLAFKETDITHQNREGQTVVHLAVRAGSLDFIELFSLVKDMRPLFEGFDKKGWSVLHHACAYKDDDVEVLTRLMELFPNLKADEFLNNAQTTETDSKGYTPLHVACTYNNRRCVQHLLAKSEVDPNVMTKGGLTALHCAAMHNDADTAKALVDAGCDPLVQEEKYGNTALHIAYKKDSNRVEKLLRERGGDALVAIRNKEGKIAAEMDLEEVIPAEIRKRGPDACRLYHEALRETPRSEQRVPRCKLMVVGEAGVGKTSLIRALTDEEFIDTPSTEGIDTSLVQTTTVEIEPDSETWKKLKEGEDHSQFHVVAAAAICEKVATANEPETEMPTKKFPHLRDYHSEDELMQKIVTIHQKRPPQASRRHVPSQPRGFRRERYEPAFDSTHSVVMRESTPRSTAPTPPRRNMEDSRSSSRSANKEQRQALQENTADQPDEPSHRNQAEKPQSQQEETFPALGRRVSQSVNERVKSKKAKSELRLVTYDFAGQDLYRPMHHCFITHRAIYIVAFKLNELMKPESRGDCYQKMAFWLNTIHAHIGRDKEPPPVYLVGTHRYTPNASGELVDGSTLKQVDEDLDKWFLHDPRLVDHIQLVEGSVMATVENSKGGEEGGAEMLRKVILEKANELPFIGRERYPLKWLKFEDGLFKIRQQVPLLGIVERESIESEATKCGIGDPEMIDLALGFFHDLGTIVDPKSLPNLFLSEEERRALHGVILLNPQQLADAMKVLMKLHPRQTYPADIKRSAIQKVLKSGVASKSFLRACWADLLPDNRDELFTQLCLFLQAFCLVIPAKRINLDQGNGEGQLQTPDQEEEYLIPSCLKLNESPLKCPRVFQLEECTCFYFDFQGYLPIELFHRFICQFLLTQGKARASGCKGEFRHGHCQLTDTSGTEWWFEVLEGRHRLKLLVGVKQEESRAAVREVHDLLATVCEESGLQGLEYTGGPLCPHCPDSRSVLPLVKYDKDGRGEPALEKVACDEQTCRMPCDAVKLLIKAVESDTEELGHLESAPTMPELTVLHINGGERVKVIEGISTNYREFGILLLKDDTGVRLKAIVLECRENPKAIITEILVRWLAGMGKEPVSWKTLIEVLKDIDLLALASDIESALQ